jgi:hypothetical protein
MDFEFGHTPQAEAFFQRHDKFGEYFVRLIELCNKCFGEARDVKGIADNPGSLAVRTARPPRSSLLSLIVWEVHLQQGYHQHSRHWDAGNRHKDAPKMTAKPPTRSSAIASS